MLVAAKGSFKDSSMRSIFLGGAAIYSLIELDHIRLAGVVFYKKDIILLGSRTKKMLLRCPGHSAQRSRPTLRGAAAGCWCRRSRHWS